jgi:hypothetical protein
MTDVAEMMFLPHLCELLTAQAPHTRLQVEQVSPAHLEEACAPASSTSPSATCRPCRR